MPLFPGLKGLKRELEQSLPVGAMQPFAPSKMAKALPDAIIGTLHRDDWRIEKSDSLYVAELVNPRGVLTYMANPRSLTFVMMVNGVKKEVGLASRLRLYFAIKKEFRLRLKHQKSELRDAHLNDAFYILQGA